MCEHERTFVLNGRRMKTREITHAYLKRKLKLPDWYGNNLDALCDCLSEFGEPTIILIRHTDALKEQLGVYGDKLLSAFAAMTGENTNLRLVVHRGF